MDRDEEDDWLLDDVTPLASASYVCGLVVPGTPVNEAVFQFENRKFSAGRPVPFIGFDDDGRPFVENMSDLRLAGFSGSAEISEIMAWLHPSREPPPSAEFLRRLLELRDD